MINMRRKTCCLLLALFLAFPLAGCGGGEPVRVVLTTGFGENEVFRIENISCTLPEVMIYLATAQNEYENVFGTQIWDSAETGMPSEQEDEADGAASVVWERLKERVLADISQVKAMTLLAARKGIVLSSGEEEAAAEAAQAYFASLSGEEIGILKVSRESLTGMYRDYALADKVYRAIIQDINPEISDDEARTITVQHIFFAAGARNADGTFSPYSEQKKAEVYDQAKKVLEQAREGEAFEALIEKFGEGDHGTCSFGKGEKEKAFETAAFNLGTGEISGIVETEEGYEIIKCITTFNQEETDRNKVKIAQRRRDEVFEQEYDSFVDSLVKNFNTELWDSLGRDSFEGVVSADFFNIYHQYFEFVKDSAGG